MDKSDFPEDFEYPRNAQVELLEEIKDEIRGLNTKINLVFWVFCAIILINDLLRWFGVAK